MPKQKHLSSVCRSRWSITVNRPARCKAGRRGIGRREIVIMLFLAGMILIVLLPYLARARAQARRAQCELHQIRLAQALLRFEADHNQFPGYKNVQAVRVDGEQVATGWVFPILPYLTAIPPNTEYGRETSRYQKGLVSDESRAAPTPYAEIYKLYGPEGEDDERGDTPSAYIAELVCPSNRPKDAGATPNWCSYIVNSGMPDATSPGDLPPDWRANGVFMDRFSEAGRKEKPVSLQYIIDHDGANSTLLLTENVDCGAWTDSGEAQVGFVWVAEFVDGQPRRGNKLLGINQSTGKGDGSIRFARPSCYHSGGVNVAFCSGRTQFFNQQSDYLAFARLMMSDSTEVRRAGSEELVDPPYRFVSPESKD
jgi:type II secretory pathway pseudopilin PulG